MPEQAADMDCPHCGTEIQGAKRTPSTRMLYLEPCGCTVAPSAFRELEIAEDGGTVAFFDATQPTAWIEADQRVYLEDRR